MVLLDNGDRLAETQCFLLKDPLFLFSNLAIVPLKDRLSACQTLRIILGYGRLFRSGASGKLHNLDEKLRNHSRV
jgi:hypothetical protein